MAEAEIMSKLSHPKLLKLFAVCTRDEPMLIVTELMRNGNLKKYLVCHEETLKLTQLINMAFQIATGMAYMESQNCVHSDLAARNVLVGDFNEVKIADFGLAQVTKKGEYNAKEGTRFPIKWTAPEAAKQFKFSIKSDVWSFGILLSELITYGKAPYPGTAFFDPPGPV